MQPTDYSTFSDDDMSMQEIAPFLRTLRQLLDTESPDIIRWKEDGLAFEILDMDNLEREVLHKYFKHNKYASFQRQLNYFHFKKWTKSHVDVCTFSNSYFTRQEPMLSACITRKRSRRDTNSSSSSPLRALTPMTKSGLPDEDVDILSKEDLEWLIQYDRLTANEGNGGNNMIVLEL
ncbi:hypothetical protein AC1031_010289 [Aphanomyces cochlioides]|nr:hypothetical protein AC1031_010289 [Aphanomyces cochlioides]